MSMSLWDDIDAIPRANTNADLDAESGLHPEDAPGGRDADTSERRPDRTTADVSSTKRLLACDPCRERKVRCDREQPRCGRCVRRSHQCSYSGPAKPSITRRDLSRLVLDLQERLSYAESQGVFRQPRPTVSSQVNNDHISWPELGNMAPLPFVPPAVETIAGLELWQSVPSLTPQLELAGDILNMHVQPTISGSMPPFATASIPPPPNVDWSRTDTRNTSNGFADSLERSGPSLMPLLMPPEQSVGSLAKLHGVYFDIFDSIMPIINRERFQAELSQSPGSMQVQALSQAMATLGALAAPELGYAADATYTWARTLLEMCERQESGADLNSINTLQTCVLLGFYELKQPNFARAWLTLGRGIRLGKIFGFMAPRRAGADGSDPEHRRQSQAALPGPDARDAEERHRTMWQLYILDAFAVMRTRWDPAFEEMTLPLPCPGSLSDIMDDTPTMPTIAEAFESADTHAISTFAGTACVISMCRRSFNHMYASQQDTSYAFWDNYYQIDKLTSKCRACFLAQHAEPVSFSKTDPLSFILFMNLAAVEVSMHKMAINKAERGHLNRGSLAAEAEKRCLEASASIAEALRACRGLGTRDLNVFHQASALFTWATATAAQAHLWMLGRGCGSRTTHLANLRVLASVIREYIGAEHVPPGLLDQVDAVLADRTKDATEGSSNLPTKRPRHTSPAGRARTTRA